MSKTCLVCGKTKRTDKGNYCNRNCWQKDNLDKHRFSSNKNRFGGNRDAVLERDNWQCQECGMTNEQHIVIFGRSITVDHIDGSGRYSKNKNHEVNNLITLCLKCHGSKDSKRRWQRE